MRQNASSGRRSAPQVGQFGWTTWAPHFRQNVSPGFMGAPQEPHAVPTATAAGLGAEGAAGVGPAAGCGGAEGTEIVTGSPRALFSAWRAMLKAPE